MLFIEYPKCTTCQKAKKWLDDHGVAYEDRHIAEQNPTAEELREWIPRSGLEIKRFFNTSGLKYKALELKDKLPAMTEEEKIALLATDGMLVKRPLIIGEDRILVGFKEKEWEEALLSD
ncbi:MAG TPA: arsenate reductase family protein [Candidatus Ventrimonas merdavium]|nr:arsenate reductase family protein [Candidatus Ventrimonas merdavium]